MDSEEQTNDSTSTDINNVSHVCATKGCGKVAELSCPTCLKLNLPPTRFCTQDCFKSSWNDHKILHKEVKKLRGDTKYLDDPTSMPTIFNNFPFTGSLRPCQKTPKRNVPESIPRPDYADHSQVGGLQFCVHYYILKEFTESFIL